MALMPPETMFSLCAQVVSKYQKEDDLDLLLDVDSGFAQRFHELCRYQMKDLVENSDTLAFREELEVLELESNTWLLLQGLIGLRKSPVAPHPTARDMLAENPYTPTSALAQAIFHHSPLLRELVSVREWLHETAPDPQPPEATTGYWKFTKHRLLHGLRTGSRKELDGLVQQMDPDAANLEDDGRALAGDDANYEKSLNQALYAYIRAGRLDEAVEFCRKAHQPWRAASINGALLFTWRAITNEPWALVDDEMLGVQSVQTWHGNKRRKLWRATCNRAALNPLLSDPERALYAALSPSPATSIVLKAACRTWEDHLWAQLSIMCEEKQTAEMTRLGGSFWEEGVAVLEKEVSFAAEDDEAEEAEWEREARTTLATLGQLHVTEGPTADNAFHVAQLYVILNRTDELLETFAEQLENGTFHPSLSTEYTNLTRFFAHLCLFLRMADIATPPLPTQKILEAYLQVLESAGQRDLIAMYAGALGENAVDRYALFLTSLELSADINERRLALKRAREHGLDPDRVAIVTAERSIERAFSILPPIRFPLPPIVTLPSVTSDAEQLLIRSIEWTTFSETTYPTALEQANVTLRYLLASGKLASARILARSLPSELGTFSEPEELATEYLHYRQFFDIWEALERVVECQALEVSSMNRDTREAWQQDLETLMNSAREMILKIFTSEWLITDNLSSTTDKRYRELVRIRQLFVPELVIRLHVMLVGTRHHIPGNLKRALELANVIADARYRLFDDFSNQDGRRLGDYLSAVQQAILAGLENGGSDPFRVLAL